MNGRGGGGEEGGRLGEEEDQRGGVEEGRRGAERGGRKLLWEARGSIIFSMSS